MWCGVVWCGVCMGGRGVNVQGSKHVECWEVGLTRAAGLIFSALTAAATLGGEDGGGSENCGPYREKKRGLHLGGIRLLSETRRRMDDARLLC